MLLPSDYLEQGWTQNALAEDANGKKTSAISLGVKWCVIGACHRALGYDVYKDPSSGFMRTVYAFMNKIAEYVPDPEVKDGYDIVNWQNELPYTQESQDLVVSVVRQAEVETGLRNAT